MRLKFKVKFINGSNLSPPTFETVTVPANENEILTKKHMLLLYYQGDKGIDLTRSLKRNLNKHLPNHVKTQVTFTGQKLSTPFNVKDRTKLEYKRDVIFFDKCSEQDCTNKYLDKFTKIICVNYRSRSQRSKIPFFRHAVVNEYRNTTYNWKRFQK